MKPFSRMIIIALLSLCALLTVVPVHGGESRHLEVTIATSPVQQTSAMISFTLRNNSSGSLEVLVWGTPLEGRFTSKTFVIFKDGQQIEYQGFLLKRAHPEEEDFVLLGPGEEIVVTVNLSYGYAITDPGTYEVTYNGFLHYRLQDQKTGQLLHTRKTSNTLLLTVTSVLDLDHFYSRSALTTSCSAEQATILAEVLLQARIYARAAADVLSLTTSSEQDIAGRYLSWFGSHSVDRYSLLSAHFTNIASALETETIEFLCDCTLDSYAKVYPAEHYEIHLCREFWTAPLTGTDSQAGIVIHEMSHFNIIAATDDTIYGKSGSYSLAQSDPAEALINADNFEYFAENDPFLPMAPLTSLQDHFSGSETSYSLKTYSLLTTYDAGKDPGEPDHAGISGGKSLWFSWYAPASGIVHATTLGSSFDTLLAVYTGDSLRNLEGIGASDDTLDNTQSEVEFTSTAGTRYHVVVDGYGGESGLAYLSLLTGFGDVNGDNLINLGDAIAALQVISRNDASSEIALEADINNDKRIGVEEVLFLLNQLGD